MDKSAQISWSSNFERGPATVPASSTGDSTGRYALGPVPPNCDAAELARRINHLQILHRVSMALTSSMQPSEMGFLLLREFLSLAEGQSAILWFVDMDNRVLLPSLHAGDFPHGLSAQSLDESSELASRTVLALSQTWKNQASLHTPTPPSIHIEGQRLCIPLVTQEEVLGIVEVRVRRRPMIPPDLEEILITLGAQASLLLRAATQRQQLEQSYNELAILHDIQQEISSTVDYAKVLKIVVDRLRSLFDAAEVTIRLVEEHGDQRVLRIAATTGRLFPGQPTVPMDQAQVDQKVMGGSILYIPDVRSDPDFADRDRATTNQIVSMITAPLIARRRVIGTIRVYMGERREFDFGERRILQAVAGMAATAIEHARLYRQVERNHRDLQESYRRLHTTQRELIKKDRLAILGEMAATVAHEVRNPLTSVRGFTQRILRRATSIQDEKIGEYSRIIIEEVDRLNGLMKDVLDYGRERRPVFSSTDFNQTIQEALALLQGELESHQIAVLLELNPTLGKLPHDASMIRIVMMNLIQNAIQAMPEGGGLMILTGSRKDHVRLRVADTGPGITREKLQKIWTPFYTTKLHGSGLGLPVVMKAIDAHHGRIIVRSKLGRGTIFDISIPYQQNLREIEDMGAMVGNNEAHSGS